MTTSTDSTTEDRVHRRASTIRMGAAYGHQPAADPDIIASLLESIKLQDAKIKAQDAKIAILEGDHRPDPDLGHSKMDSHMEPLDGEHINSFLRAKYANVIPEVRVCNVTQFKNRFGSDQQEYAVDALISDTLIDQEILGELQIRRSHPKRRPLARDPLSRNAPDVVEPPTTLVDTAVHTEQTDVKIISRIRIQSPAIRMILSKIMEEMWDDMPRTFFRPFGPLVYFHAKMVEALADLEAKWASQDNDDALLARSNQDSAVGDSEEAQPTVDDSPVALADMRCYVEFMEAEIMPLSRQFDNVADPSNAKVRFQDLWFLFHPGDLIYRDVGDRDTTRSGLLGSAQRAWRVYGTGPFWPKFRLPSADHKKYSRHHEDDEKTPFKIFAYHIDYNGDEFSVVTETFEIQPFEGEKKIVSLKVHPYRFLPNHEHKLQLYINFGKDFLHYIDTKHGNYKGWTLTHNPRGDPATDSEGNYVKHPEYINSEVIVDFFEAFQVMQSWKPQRSILKATESDPSTTADEFWTCWWSDASRSRLLMQSTEIIVIKSGVTTDQMNAYLKKDPFLVAVRENDREGRPTTRKYLRDIDLPLLPIRLFAYVLADRKFVQIDVQKLKPVKECTDAFDCLKIPTQRKTELQAVVESHFLKKSIEKSTGTGSLTQDLIPGKGNGLCILLYGVPGVGKTATAHAVARASGKCLFPITCGDLGLKPKEVETALKGIFRLANIWDCVLLLDEVDTFFSQRSKGDATLTKNALSTGEHVFRIFSFEPPKAWRVSPMPQSTLYNTHNLA
jgi:ATPase family associated with various cellular activities (AAA)